MDFVTHSKSFSLPTMISLSCIINKMENCEKEEECSLLFFLVRVAVARNQSFYHAHYFIDTIRAFRIYRPPIIKLLLLLLSVAHSSIDLFAEVAVTIARFHHIHNRCRSSLRLKLEALLRSLVKPIVAAIIQW
jgi:hypothetical protein